MNFATLKGLTIPEGSVESIAIGGQTVWAKAPDDPWAAVFASIDDGTYKEKYSIGDTVPLDLGSEGVVNMEVVGIDVNDLADGSGKAPISWISKETLNTEHRMNPALVTNDDGTYQEGTGTIGGWGSSEMRAYLNNTILPLIPENVRGMIKTVTNKQDSYNTAGTKETQYTEDSVWIPLHTGGGLTYSKKKRNQTNNPVAWWCRDALFTSSFYCIDTTGSFGAIKNANLKYSIALGFCT